MKPTQEQIQELYTFTRKHFVEHYDLQTELVDHLSNGIEEQWKENPHLTFKEALNKEFKKFGVCGFHDVITEKAKAINKKYWKIILGFYREYFRLPKILMILAAIALTYTIVMTFSIEVRKFVLPSGMLICLLPLLGASIRNKRKYKNLEKKWMLQERIYLYGDIFQVLPLSIHLFNGINGTGVGIMASTYFVLGASIFLVCLIVLCYVMVIVIPPKAQELLEETYPEYKLI